jgi:hypothetical protein
MTLTPPPDKNSLIAEGFPSLQRDFVKAANYSEYLSQGFNMLIRSLD